MTLLQIVVLTLGLGLAAVHGFVLRRELNRRRRNRRATEAPSNPLEEMLAVDHASYLNVTTLYKPAATVSAPPLAALIQAKTYTSHLTPTKSIAGASHGSVIAALDAPIKELPYPLASATDDIKEYIH